MMTTSDTDWVLRGVALVEAALRPEPLLSADGAFFALLGDLDSEDALSVIISLLSVIARLGVELDRAAIQAILDQTRVDAVLGSSL